MSDVFGIRVNDRIELQPLAAVHRSRCVELLDDPDLERYLLRVPSPYTVEDFNEFLNIVDSAAAERDHPTNFAICDATEGFIGGFGFEKLEPGHSLEIGYWVGKEFWGRGVMTEVVAAACRFAVEQWQIKRIAAYVFCGNDASTRVLEKNGFRKEGLLRKKFRKHGQFIDAYLYAKIF